MLAGRLALVALATSLALPRASRAGPREELQAADPATRLKAVSALEADGSAAALAVLTEALASRDPGVRGSAVKALARKGGTAQVPTLAPLLGDDSEDVRAATREALTSLAPAPGAGQALAKVLPTLSPNARAGLPGVLAASTDVEGLRSLAELLSDKDADVKAAADRTLRLAGPDRAGVAISQCLEFAQDFARLACAQFAGDAKVAGALPALSAAAVDDYGPKDIRTVARSAVLAMKDDLDAPALAEKARAAKERDGRIGALRILALIGGDRSYVELTRALGDSDELVRSAAAAGLAELGDARAIGPLRKALAKSANGRISARIQRSIERLARPGT